MSIFSDLFEVSQDEINSDSSSDTIERWDSLGHLNLVIAIEEAFKVKVDKVNTLITPKGKKKVYIKLSDETPAIDVVTQLGLM